MATTRFKTNTTSNSFQKKIYVENRKCNNAALPGLVRLITAAAKRGRDSDKGEARKMKTGALPPVEGCSFAQRERNTIKSVSGTLLYSYWYLHCADCCTVHALAAAPCRKEKRPCRELQLPQPRISVLQATLPAY
ncbi:hypothetical protein E2320_015883 [Naja naja]|nr:hypothetical protein E2320_015883 [Naja naja]